MRVRHQNGRVELTPEKTWRAHWYVYVVDQVTGKEVRKHRSKVVGTKAEMRKFEAQEQLNKLVAPVNTQGTRSDDRVTLAWFWENRFKPLREGNWVDATLRGCEGDWANYVKPTLGDLPLKDIGLFECQKLLNSLAKKNFSESVVGRVRVMISSMLEDAVDLDFLPKNPAKKLKTPNCKPTEKPVIDAAKLNTLIDAVADQRDHLILVLGIFGSMVSSEVFALTWGAFNGDYLEVKSIAYQGELHVGRVKRKARHRNIHLPEAIRREIDAWKAATKHSTAPGALMFPAARVMLTEEQKQQAKVVGQKIREMRERTGLSQGKLAKQFNLRQSALSKIERGVRHVTPAELNAICEKLGIPPLHGAHEIGEQNGPMWPGIWLQKRIQPIAKSLGITEPVTFQVMRRSFATRNQQRLKDTQTHLGHGSIETTGNIYAQGVEESVREMVNADFARVMGAKPTPSKPPKGRVLNMVRKAGN